MTHICVAIPVDCAADVPQALQTLARAHADGATMVEWRVDALAEEPDALAHIRTLVRQSPVPSIVTIRGAREGGHYRGDDMQRVSLIEAIGTGGTPATVAPHASAEPLAPPSSATPAFPAPSSLTPLAPSTSPAPSEVPAYIDFELADFERSANLRQKLLLAVQHLGQVRTVGARLILSAHDFEGRPPALARQVAAMAAQEACAVAKLVWRARSVRDNIEAFELLAERHKPTIALCMGEAGVMSRVLAPKFGAFLTFARAGGPGDPDAAAANAVGAAGAAGGATSGGAAAGSSGASAAAALSAGTAAGQPAVRELVHDYGIARVGAATRVYGVIGWPVAHSQSPRTHNAWFRQHGFDGVYVPLPVPPEYEHFKASLLALLDYAPLHFRGASVTMPHKGHLVRFVREWNERAPGKGIVEPLAARIGAANTLGVQDDGTLVAVNTDAPAAVEALVEGMGDGADPARLSHLRVAIIGAGGVARAVAAGLADAGARVVVFARTPENAQKLAEELAGEHAHVVAGRMEQLGCGCFHAFVNCTPVGMEGGPDPNVVPLPDDVPLDASVTVMDTVYAPRVTPLLQLARARGARTVDGWSMFIKQAARQFELWAGGKPARELC